jgi:methionine-rich copper-binding protein CopC
MAMAFPFISRAAAAAAFIALTMTSAPQAADAHALLQSASPSVGGSVAGSPSAIRLEFSEGVEVRYSQVSVTGPGGTVLVSHPANGGAKSTLAVKVDQTLKPGRYRVHWSALSVDTHRTQGSFSFEVRP